MPQQDDELSQFDSLLSKKKKSPGDELDEFDRLTKRPSLAQRVRDRISAIGDDDEVSDPTSGYTTRRSETRSESVPSEPTKQNPKPTAQDESLSPMRDLLEDAATRMPGDSPFPSKPGELGKGLMRGAGQLASVAGSAMQTATGGYVGETPRKIGKAFQETAGEPRIKRVKDIRGVGDALDYGKRVVGETVPWVGADVAAGVAGGPLGVYGMQGVIVSGMIREELEAQGVTDEPTILKVTALIGVPAAAAGGALPAMVLRNIVGSAVRKRVVELGLAGTAKFAAKEVAKHAATGAAGLAAQQGTIYAGTRLATGKPVNPGELGEVVASSAELGATAGAIFGGVAVPGHVKEQARRNRSYDYDAEALQSGVYAPAKLHPDTPGEVAARIQRSAETNRDRAARKAAEPERIIAAAVRVNGNTYTGQIHSDAVRAAIDAGDLPPELLSTGEMDATHLDHGAVDLFLTNKNRLVTPEEAEGIANAADQIRSDRGGAPGKLDAIDLKTQEAAAPKVGEMRTMDIHSDPSRFQFRTGKDPRTGAGGPLTKVDLYREDVAGILTVWRDPADGLVYIVNGHHRLDLAKRSATPTVLVRFLTAPNAEAARTQGAIQNIAEGNGTPTDVAKFLRETRQTLEDLKAQGVPVEGTLAEKGIGLSRLSTDLFQKVATGKIDEAVGVGIGSVTADPDMQRTAVAVIAKSGKRLTEKEAADVARQIVAEGSENVSQETLFGTEQDRVPLYVEKAQLAGAIQRRLESDKRLFSYVTKGTRAEELGRAGNRIDKERSAEIATQSAQLGEVFRQLFTRKGAVSDALTEGARRLTHGDKPQAVADSIYEGIRAEIQAAFSGGKGQDLSGDQSAARGHEEAGRAPEEVTTEHVEVDPNQEDLLGEPSGVYERSETSKPAVAARERKEREGLVSRLRQQVVDAGGLTTSGDRHAFASEARDILRRNAGNHEQARRELVDLADDFMPIEGAVPDKDTSPAQLHRDRQARYEARKRGETGEHLNLRKGGLPRGTQQRNSDPSPKAQAHREKQRRYEARKRGETGEEVALRKMGRKSGDATEGHEVPAPAAEPSNDPYVLLYRAAKAARVKEQDDLFGYTSKDDRQESLFDEDAGKTQKSSGTFKEKAAAAREKAAFLRKQLERMEADPKWNRSHTEPIREEIAELERVANFTEKLRTEEIELRADGDETVDNGQGKLLEPGDNYLKAFAAFVRKTLGLPPKETSKPKRGLPTLKEIAQRHGLVRPPGGEEHLSPEMKKSVDARRVAGNRDPFWRGMNEFWNDAGHDGRLALLKKMRKRYGKYGPEFADRFARMAIEDLPDDVMTSIGRERSEMYQAMRDDLGVREGRDPDQQDLFFTYGSPEKQEAAVKKVIEGAGKYVTVDDVQQRGRRILTSSERQRNVLAGTEARRKATVTLKGKIVKGAHDLAQLLYPFRSPEFEQFHVILTDDDGKILSHTIDSSGVINYSMIPERLTREIARTAKRIGATRVHLGHNHPSGDPTTSRDDGQVTARLAYELKRRGLTLVDHVVTNHKTMSWLKPHGEMKRTGGKLTVGDKLPYDPPALAEQTDWTQGHGAKLASPQELAHMTAGALQGDNFAVVYVTSQGHTLALEPRPASDMAKISKWIDLALKLHAADRVAIVFDREMHGDVIPAMLDLLDAAPQLAQHIFDVVSFDGKESFVTDHPGALDIRNDTFIPPKPNKRILGEPNGEGYDRAAAEGEDPDGARGARSEESADDARREERSPLPKAAGETEGVKSRADRIVDGEGLPAVRDDEGKIWSRRQAAEHGDIIAHAEDEGSAFTAKDGSQTGWILDKKFVSLKDLQPEMVEGKHYTRVKEAEKAGYGPNAEPERIKSAAIRTPSGEIVEGITHPQAFWIAQSKSSTPLLETEESQGFTTTRGRFVSRDEAYEIAEAADQVRKDRYWPGNKLDSYDVFDEDQNNPNRKIREDQKGYDIVTDDQLDAGMLPGYESDLKPHESPFSAGTPAVQAIRAKLGLPPLPRPPRALIEISRDLADQAGVPLRQGRFNAGVRQALGVFFPHAETTRVRRYDDVPTVAHEVGHFTSKKHLGNPANKGAAVRGAMPLTKGMLKELREMGKRLYGSRQPAAGYGEEGIAEAFKFFVTDPPRLTAEAPEFAVALEARLKTNPTIHRALLQAREDYAAHQANPATARADALISVNERVRNRPSVDELVRQAVDDLDPFKKAVAQIGGTDDITKNAYVLARLTRGDAGIAEEMNQRGVVDFKTRSRVTKGIIPVLRSIPPEKLQAFRRYLLAERALELWDRNIDVGQTKADAISIKKMYEAEFGSQAQELWAHSNALLKYRHDAGLLTDAEYKAIADRNKRRVPLYVVFDEAKDNAGVGKGWGKKWGRNSSGINAIKGSARRKIDPLESILQDTYKTVEQANRHNVAATLYKLGLEKEGGGRVIEEVEHPKERMAVNVPRVLNQLVDLGIVDPNNLVLTGNGSIAVKDSNGKTVDLDGLVLEQWDPREHQNAKDEKDMVIPVVIDGTRHWLQIQDPKLFEAVQSLGPEQRGQWGWFVGSILRGAGRGLRAGATLTPEFLGRNPWRDMFTAAAYTRSTNPVDAVPGVIFAKGLFHFAKADDVFQRWRLEGGDNAAQLAIDRKEIQSHIDHVTRNFNKVARDLVIHPIDTLRLVSAAMENATRVGEYSVVEKSRLKAGDTPRQAAVTGAIAARDITIDFGRHGVAARSINQIVAFFNANVQGTDKLIQEHRRRPGTVAMRALAGITIPSLVLFAMQHDDPDYRKLPRWRRSLCWNWVQRDTNGKLVHIWSLPKPFELGILYGTLPEAIAEWWLEHDAAGFKAFADAAVQGFTPGVVPTALLPLIENWANKSFFTNRKIVPANAERREPAYQTREYTGEAARAIGETVDYSPAKIENLVQGWWGGLGRNYALPAANLATRYVRSLEGKEPSKRPNPVSDDPLTDVPFVKGFMAHPPSGGETEQVDEFYTQWELADQVRNSYKALLSGGRRAEAHDYAVSHRAELAAMRTADSPQGTGKLRDAYNRLEKVRDQRTDILRDDKLSEAEKKRRVRILDDRMVKIAEQGLAALK